MRIRTAGLLAAGLLAAGPLSVGPTRAEVTRFELQGAATAAFGGQEFGPAGRYERIVAKATIALDPADARNAIIADLALAPRNARARWRRRRTSSSSARPRPPAATARCCWKCRTAAGRSSAS